MSAPNIDIHVLLFHAVVVDPEEFVPSKLKIKTRNAEIKNHLENSKLLKWRTKGNALYLAANDATWRWVNEAPEYAATVAGGEGGVMTPRTWLIGRRITGWKRLLGRFVDGCILSPQYLRLGAKPVVEL
jgi:hypothetical protein